MHDARANGTHALTCDTPGCHHEMIAPSPEDLVDDMNLAGWAEVGKDKAGAILHGCPHCTRGSHPGAAIMKRMLGGDEVEVEAPAPVSKGDDARADDGTLIGHYMADAAPGDPVKIKLQFPEPQLPPSMVQRFDTMLEGSDDDDDAAGRVQVAQKSVVAPTPVAAPIPKAPRGGMEAPAGSSGGGGVVQAAPRPDTTTPKAKEAMEKGARTRQGPQINTAAIQETADIFEGMAWDPDDD